MKKEGSAHLTLIGHTECQGHRRKQPTKRDFVNAWQNWERQDSKTKNIAHS